MDNSSSHKAAHKQRLRGPVGVVGRACSISLKPLRARLPYSKNKDYICLLVIKMTGN